MDEWEKIQGYEGLYEEYKDLPNIKLPSDVRDYFKDNTVLNTLIAQGRVSV